MAKSENPSAGKDNVGAAVKDSENLIRDQRDKAYRLYQLWEHNLQEFHRIFPEEGEASPPIGPLRYANMNVIDAILLYLERTQIPHTREHLVAEVLAGGAYEGKGKKKNPSSPGGPGLPEVQINKSIDYWLMSTADKQKIYGKRIKTADPKLRQVCSLIGKAEWPDEKFAA